MWVLIAIFVVLLIFCALIEGVSVWSFTRLIDLGKSDKHRTLYRVLSTILIGLVVAAAATMIYLHRSDIAEEWRLFWG